MVNHTLITESLRLAEEAASLEPGNPVHLKDIRFWTAMAEGEGLIKSER